MAINENLLATIDAVESLGQRIRQNWNPLPYRNRHDVWGRYLYFRGAEIHTSISISNCEQQISPEDVLYLLRGIKVIEEDRWGGYLNNKCVPGFYATAHSSHTLNGKSHWLMISRSPDYRMLTILKRKPFLTEREQDLVQFLEEQERKKRKIP